MGRIINLLSRLRLKLASPTERANLMRSKMHFVGKNVQLFTVSFGTEPYLISIHDNVVCAANVSFVTHDVSCFNVARYLKLSEGCLDKVGSIELHDNCFVGANTLLMPNCSVGKNSIVAAGSVVTSKIPDGEVWGGVPAKYIMSIDEYAKKTLDTVSNYPWMKNNIKICDGIELQQMREDYFFKRLD